jgi:ABC-2 type transport system ATP-binding protein
VKSPDADDLARLIGADGGQVTRDGATLTVVGLDAPRIADLAARNGVVVHELTPVLPSLEEAFMELTAS